ncbi:hypothetical protein HNP81_000804 [Peribacillus huizhouensis]|uniref:Uncharacterized protein n=1 Tax=Peribacillus huizhouensis TaxID=1501239 RepID=A0ABR6CLE3_9BACI|nr:hypothetical protein [Peribacillus huizhouensis]
MGFCPLSQIEKSEANPTIYPALTESQDPISSLGGGQTFRKKPEWWDTVILYLCAFQK